MISLSQPSMYSSAGLAPMQKRITPEPIPMMQRKPSPLSMATDIAETKAIDYALNQVGKEGAKKALSAAGGAMMGPMGAIGGEVVGEMLAPFLKSLFFARGGYAGPLAMQPGGEVPSKFKGFAKLPEAVQQKISPDLAKKYDMGGRVGPDKSGEELMFSNMGMSPTSANSTFQNFLQSGKMPLGAGYSVKPDAGKGSGSLTLEYQMSKDPTMNMMTGIKNMFNNFRGR
tara:strand:+ start:864 stop:1547 length:684 start_codon:yes stop_codon:yes gene_type:complete